MFDRWPTQQGGRVHCIAPPDHGTGMSTIIGVTCGITNADLNVCLSSTRASSMPIRAATDHPSHAVTIGRARTTWYQQVERVKRYQQVERVKRPHAVSTNRVAQASFNKAADSQCASGGWSEQYCQATARLTRLYCTSAPLATSSRRPALRRGHASRSRLPRLKSSTHVVGRRAGLCTHLPLLTWE